MIISYYLVPVGVQWSQQAFMIFDARTSDFSTMTGSARVVHKKLRKKQLKKQQQYKAYNTEILFGYPKCIIYSHLLLSTWKNMTETANKSQEPNTLTNSLIQHDQLSGNYNNETPPKDFKIKAPSIIPPKYAVIIYITVFFFAMIAHELALEAVSSNFPELESLAGSVTLFQFGFCFLLPLIISKGKVLETFPRTFKEVLPYVRLSFLVFGATGAATQSLRYVSYP